MPIIKGYKPEDKQASVAKCIRNAGMPTGKGRPAPDAFGEESPAVDYSTFFNGLDQIEAMLDEMAKLPNKDKLFLLNGEDTVLNQETLELEDGNTNNYPHEDAWPVSRIIRSNDTIGAKGIDKHGNTALALFEHICTQAYKQNPDAVTEEIGERVDNIIKRMEVFGGNRGAFADFDLTNPVLPQLPQNPLTQVRSKESNSREGTPDSGYITDDDSLSNSINTPNSTNILSNGSFTKRIEAERSLKPGNGQLIV